MLPFFTSALFVWTSVPAVIEGRKRDLSNGVSGGWIARLS